MFLPSHVPFSYSGLRIFWNIDFQVTSRCPSHILCDMSQVPAVLSGLRVTGFGCEWQPPTSHHPGAKCGLLLRHVGEMWFFKNGSSLHMLTAPLSKIKVYPSSIFVKISWNRWWNPSLLSVSFMFFLQCSRFALKLSGFVFYYLHNASPLLNWTHINGL